MNKDKLSYYASYVAIICGVLIFSMRFFVKELSLGRTVMGLLFIAIGIIGIRGFRNKK